MVDEIAVIGAGLQGCCVALGLARHGKRVLLIDRDHLPMNRASRRNEGKIHLGLTYANEPAAETGLLQLRGALAFGRLLRRWVGPSIDAVPVSTTFHYLVARDSILSSDRLAEHYRRLETACSALLAENPQNSYLGERPERLAWLRDRREPAAYNAGRFEAVFETAERAVDTDVLADCIVRAVAAEPLIRFAGGVEVRDVERRPESFRIRGRAKDGTTDHEAGQVVNASWDSLFRIDLTAGLPVTPGWLFRLKFRVIAALPENLRGSPSATMVLGPYGDVVVRPDNTAYLSWYPSGLQGWSHEVEPPRDWDAACRGEADPHAAAGLAREIVGRIAEWYPSIADARPMVVDAGVIVARGSTDVGDKNSGLHSRNDSAIRSRSGYYSINTGKLTTAPLYADWLVEMLVNEREAHHESAV